MGGQNIEKGDHFARLRALVDGGWLARLTGTELAVWLVCARFETGGTGETRVSAARIARAVGHADARHVQRARRRLVRVGLLADAATAGGPSRWALLLPPDPRRNTPGADLAGGRKRHRTPGGIGRQPPAESATLNTRKYKMKMQSAARAAPGAAPAGAHAQLIAHFSAGWQARFGTAYIFARGRDGAHARDILAAVGGDLAAAKALVDRYLGSTDPWLDERGRTLGLLRAQINRFRLKGEPNARHTAAARGEFPEPDLAGQLAQLAARNGARSK